MYLPSWWGPLPSNRWKYATLAARRIDVQTRDFNLVRRVQKSWRRMFWKSDANSPRWENASMRDSSQLLWPAESSFSLGNMVNPRFTTSIVRRGLLCSWTTLEIYEIIYVFIDERVRSEAGRPGEYTIHAVVWITWSTLKLHNPTSSKNICHLYWQKSPLWGWMTQEVLQHYVRNLVYDLIYQQRFWSRQGWSTLRLDYSLIVYRPSSRVMRSGKRTL